MSVTSVQKKHWFINSICWGYTQLSEYANSTRSVPIICNDLFLVGLNTVNHHLLPVKSCFSAFYRLYPLPDIICLAFIPLYLPWLVVWNMNFMTFHILGVSSSQLTNSIIFQRGRYITNQIRNVNLEMIVIHTYI